MELYIVLDKEYFKQLINPEKCFILTYPYLVNTAKLYTKNVFEISPISFNDRKNLCKIFTDEFYSKLGDHPDFLQYLEPHVNNIFEYVVCPLFKVISSIDQLISLHDFSNIHIYGGNKDSVFYSTYGIQSIEENRKIIYQNSWFYNYFIYHIFKNKINLIFHEESYYKILFLKYFRRILIFLYMSSRFILKHLFMSLQNRKTIDIKSNSFQKPLFIFPIRSIHQLRSIKNLTIKLQEIGFHPIILKYEMLFGEGTNRYIKNNFDGIQVLSLFQLHYLFTILKIIALNIFKFTKNIFFKDKIFSLNYKYHLSIPLNEFISEFYLFPSFQSYSSILSDYLKKIMRFNPNIPYLISSEMIDKNAFFERYAAKQSLLPFYNIQTALLMYEPCPVISVGDILFVNGFDIANRLNHLGYKNKGTIKYAGPLKYVGLIKKFPDKNERKPTLKNILFLSQPYNYHIFIPLIEEIAKWSNESNNQINFTIKLHPRDRLELYRELILKKYKLSFLGNDSDLYRLMEGSDLVISAASSALQESLIIGTPYICCLFDEDDRQIKADYIDIKNYNVCYNKNDLLERLNNYEAVCDNYHDFRKKYFTEQKIPFSDDEIVKEFISSLKP